MVVLMLQWERFLFVFISRITKSLAISWNFFPHTIVVVVLISNNIPLSLRNLNNKTTTNQNSFNAPQLLWIFLLHIILSTTQKQSCNKVICVNNLSHTCIGYEISEFRVWRLMCLSFLFFFFPAAHSCPVGQIYINCSNPQVDAELSRERTCENQLLNLTFSAHLPCVSGCVCPPGWVFCVVC